MSYIILKTMFYKSFLLTCESEWLIVNNYKQTKKEIQEKIKKVDGAMAQEGMPLTKELKQKLYNCIIGKSSTEIERKKVIEKYKNL